MNKATIMVSRLYLLRNKYGTEHSKEKSNLLDALGEEKITGKGTLKLYYETLLFLLAYPDNKIIRQKTGACLQALESYLEKHFGVAWSLFNTGITGTRLCAAFSFDMIKWWRQNHREDVALDSIEAQDGQIRSVLSAVMPKVESEVLQDENFVWQEWLKKTGNKGEDLLDRLLRIFDQSSIRPEVKDELWQALGINVVITLMQHTTLPDELTYPYYHRSLIKSKGAYTPAKAKPVQIKLNEEQCGQIVDCARLILVRHLREMDPMTYTAPSLVAYYKLERGLTVALYSMTPERRHPLDSYIGYVAFKNGLPVAYGATWILFDSARIALNVFPAYRGGESRYIFEEVMNLHQQVYHLKRFTVDPYQIGKNNDDGIHSGSFWLYHHIGFRPIKEKQNKLAQEEYLKIKSAPGYRTPPAVLKVLADSRLELILKPGPVRFDAVDAGVAYQNILKTRYNNNRKIGEETAFSKLAKLLGIKNSNEPKINFILRNWAVLLMWREAEIRKSPALRNELRKVFELKAYGLEEDFIGAMQKSGLLRKWFGEIIEENSFG